MPLSDHEQRLLEQIEQALYDEDPKFARLYRATDVRSHYRGRVVRAVLGVLFGIAMLLAGVITTLIVLGVLGFLVMLTSVTYGIASWQRMTGHRVVASHDRPKLQRRARRERGRTEHRSITKRLEDRWQRRQDGGRP
ncbi:MAG TPA: DUF3040 domain-containing protein [Mycobacteriales bacterium]|nr:DUF3040 domain-containing protein [Mycobacteriales bacterium]HVX69017.1 DUF3040 domain-containing protein [Mycobacteriales bacterium]